MDIQNRYAKIDYGYAITSHKSQGSTYDTVIVDENDINSVNKTSNGNKSESIYTALTRAKNVSISIKFGVEPETTPDLKTLND